MPPRTQSRSRSSRPEPQEDRRVAVMSPEEAKAAATGIQRSLEGRRDQLLSMLGGDEKLTDKFLTVALSAVVKPGSGLLEADPLSILNSVRDAAQMGLEPAGPLGEGAIVAYAGVAQFQPMVRGLRKLALQHPDVSVVNVGIRHSKDVFEYREGSDPFVRHEPWIDDDNPGDVMGAYAYARLNGETLAMYMNLAQIRKRQTVARNQKVWQAWPEEMMKKTVLRRFISEKLPMTTKLSLALAVEEADLDRNPTAPVVATVSRTAARQLSAGDDVDGSQAADTADPTVDAPRASDADIVCGAPGMKEGVTCDLAKGHPRSVPHDNGKGETWG